MMCESASQICIKERFLLRAIKQTCGLMKELMLHATMERLQNMETGYEMLGTTILQSLKQVEKMEEEFHALQSELVTSGCPLMTITHHKKSKKTHKGKRKGASSDSDGLNSGSSRSESSSAQSSSRPTNTQAEETKAASSGSEQPPYKVAEEKNLASDGKADSKSASKPKKKKTSQKIEKKKGQKAEATNDNVNPENRKRSSLTSEEVSTPVQASGNAVPLPMPETASLTVAAKEEKGVVPNSGKVPNNALSEGVPSSSSAAIEGVQLQEGTKVPGSETKKQSWDGRPMVLEVSRSSKGEGDFIGVENKLVLPKVSLNVLDVKPSDSASVQVLAKPKRKSRRLSSEVSKDETVQTDDVAILSLEDCDVDALQSREYQAADVKDLLEKLKNLQKQLQFWRTKNWAERHTGQGHMMTPPMYKQFITVDASPDMGMLCYYNARTGVHMMKNVAELDASIQQSILHLVDGPSQSP